MDKGSQNEIVDGADVQKSLKVEKMHHFLWLAISRNTKSLTILPIAENAQNIVFLSKG